MLLVDEQDDWEEAEETLAMSTSRDEEEIGALVAEFKTLISEQDSGLHEEGIIRSMVTLKESRNNTTTTLLDIIFSFHAPTSSTPNLECADPRRAIAARCWNESGSQKPLKIERRIRR